MFHKLQEGAIFIADVHYPNHKKEEFLAFLTAIKEKRIKTSQLILMGDIFDLLLEQSSFLKNLFEKEIALINDIAKKIEVIYLEGNHDFNLASIFVNAKVVPLQKQPLLLQNNNKIYALSHGDKFVMPFSYKIFTFFIRNKLFLHLLPEIVAKYQLQKMKKKKICKKISHFQEKVLQILTHYKSDFVIEGHYHQGKILKNYIALPSFACSQKLARFDKNKITFFSFI